MVRVYTKPIMRTRRAPAPRNIACPPSANPRLLAISPLPPDLYAALKAKYGMTDYTTLGGAPGKPVPAPGFDIAVTMGVYGIDAALIAAMPDLKLVACNGAGLEQDRSGAGARARHRRMPYAGRTGGRCRRRGDRADLCDHAAGGRGRPFRAQRALAQGAADAVAAPCGQDDGRCRAGPDRAADRRSRRGHRHEGGVLRPPPQPDVPYPFCPRHLWRSPAEADVLVLACPGGEETHHLVNRGVLERLGPEGYLVNVARGSVVDEAALLDALENQDNRRGGARRVRVRAEHRSALYRARKCGVAAALGVDHPRDARGDGRAASVVISMRF